MSHAKTIPAASGPLLLLGFTFDAQLDLSLAESSGLQAFYRLLESCHALFSSNRLQRSDTQSIHLALTGISEACSQHVSPQHTRRICSGVRDPPSAISLSKPCEHPLDISLLVVKQIIINKITTIFCLPGRPDTAIFNRIS